MKKPLVVLILVAATALGQQPAGLTLEQAIATARQNSRALRVAAARADAAEARAGEAGAALLPGLRFSGNYTKLAPGDFELNVPVAGRPLTVAPVVDNTFAFRLGLQQPLFTGSRLSGQADAAEYQAQASALDLEMAEADLVFGVTSAYWVLYQSLRAQRVVDDNVARLTSYRADTQRLMAAGLATRNDLLKIEVQLANARVAQIDARNDAQLAMMNLNSAIGQPLDTEVRPASDPVAASDSLSALAEAREDQVLARVAWDGRTDLRAAGLLTESARAGLRAARGGYWPQIDLAAGYLYNRPNSRYQPVTPSFLGSWDIGVNLQFDVWNWGRTARQAEQAEAALRQSEQQRAQLHDNVTLDVQRAALGVRRSREKLGVSHLALEQARENLRMTQEKFRAGLAASSELLDAEVALAQAETADTGAVVDVALARARLARACGRSGR